MQPEQTEKLGIKETVEAIHGLKAIAVPVKKALKDGKINAEDAPHALELLSNHQVIIDGALGADKVIPEVKDLSTEELAVIGAETLAALKAVKEA